MKTTVTLTVSVRNGPVTVDCEEFNYHGMTLALHRPIGMQGDRNEGWTVTEPITGRRVATTVAGSKTEAKKRAARRIEKSGGVEKLREVISQFTKYEKENT